MIFWLDARLSPALAVWLRMRFDLDAPRRPQALPDVLPMLESGEPLVEIGDAW